MCRCKEHSGCKCLDGASKHGDKVPRRGAARVPIIIKEDPANPWYEDEPAIVASDATLRATLMTSKGREDSAVFQAYDGKHN